MFLISKTPSDEGAGTALAVTEGETFNGHVNKLAYTTKIAGNIQIANSHYVRFIDSKSFVRISSFLACSAV